MHTLKRERAERLSRNERTARKPRLKSLATSRGAFLFGPFPSWAACRLELVSDAPAAVFAEASAAPARVSARAAEVAAAVFARLAAF